jgi:hypothetical protein
MENYCTPNWIANQLNTSFASGAHVEMATRPAYGMISSIFARLKAAGIA